MTSAMNGPHARERGSAHRARRAQALTARQPTERAERPFCRPPRIAGNDHRYTPLWPRERRPGWGNRESPCGLEPTGMTCRILPLRVLITETEALNRLETPS